MGTSQALSGFPYTSFGKHRFACISVVANGHSHTYEYGLPVNFTRTSSFCAGCVFIQPVQSKLPVNSTNIIFTKLAYGSII